MSSDPTVRLGLMPPFTGVCGIYGQEISWAGRIACQDVNENGGVLGRPLELVVEDDGSLPESSVRAAEKLLGEHGCLGLIGNLMTNSRIAVAYRVAEPRRIPYLCFSLYEGSVLSRYYFQFAALPNQQIDLMIPYMKERYGPKMFFCGNNYEWPRGSIDAAKRVLEKTNGQVVGEQYYPIGLSQEEACSLMDLVLQSGADVLVPFFAGADELTVLTQFARSGLNKRIKVVMTHFDEVMASHLSPEVREGLFSSNSYFMSVDTEENRAYLAKLAAIPGVSGIWPGGNGIVTNFGEGTYLCVKAFAQAANEAGNLDPEAIVAALETVSLTGPQGCVRMDGKTHHASVNSYLARCQTDGAFSIVESFGPIEAVIPERYQYQKINPGLDLEALRLQAKIVERMNDAVCLIDAASGIINYVNPGLERMFGYDRNEIIGMSVSTLSPNFARETDDFFGEINSVLYEKGVWCGERRAVKKDGTPFWSLVTISAFTHPAGERWLANLIDITERKRAEDQVHRQAEILQGINELFQEALTCQTDVEVAKTCLSLAERLTQSEFGFIDEVNERGRLDAIVLSEAGWRACLIPEANAVKLLRDMEISGILGRVLKDQKSLVINDLASHPDRVNVPEGQLPVHCFLGVPLRHGGKTIGIIGLANKQSGYDLADQEAIEALSLAFVEALMRKRAEQGLRKAHDQLEVRVQERTSDLTRANADLEQARQAAEAASRAKSTFLANMSHEIRTPLNAVIGMTELVLKSQLSTRQHEYLKTVRDSGEALLSVINDILDFSKIEAGKLELEHKSFDLRDSLGDTMKSFAIGAQMKGLELTCFIHPEVPRMVAGDYNRLRQIVMNLVSNAIKFTDTGEVDVLVETESSSRDYVVLHFTVSDTGVGIPEDKRATIFRMFEQADVSTTRRHGGTGLGLAIASRLVGLMNGRIWLDAEARQGASFNFTIRLDLDSQEQDVHPQTDTDALSGIRVLVVDDNATARQILEEVLRSWEMIPDIASGAFPAMSALERAQQAGNPYRVLIVDAHMPDVDGFALVREINKNPALDNTVIMMLTSGDCLDDMPRCKQLGIAAYLLKPIKQSELLEAIQMALGLIIAPPPQSETLCEPRPRVANLRILVAEDSLINQQLAVALLEGQGHQVTLSDNGRQALSESSARPFDLILMDVQMPEMDGFEATAQIRDREKQTGAHIPIVAMTACAMKEDETRCLEAGMDRYISKPIRAKELFDLIDELLASKTASSDDELQPQNIVDWVKVLEIADDHPEVAREMMKTAHKELSQIVVTVHQSLEDGEYDRLRSAFHKLRGSSWYLCSSRACELAGRLEAAAGQLDFAQTTAIGAELEVEMNHIIQALSVYMQGD